MLFTRRLLNFGALFASAAIGCAAATNTPANPVTNSPAAVSSGATFSQRLTPPDWVGAGFGRLSAKQIGALDSLIQRDIDSARQGDVVAFAKSFSDRRTAEERQWSGIDQLTPAERARLDSLVAAAIAVRPSFAYVPEPPANGTAHDVTTVPRPWEVHGEVSMFVGGGSGTSFYGGSFDTWATDPSHRLTVGVGASEVRGKGRGFGCGYGPLW